MQMKQIPQRASRGIFFNMWKCSEIREGGQQDFPDPISILGSADILFAVLLSRHFCFSPCPASKGNIQHPNALRDALWGLANVSKI